MRRPIIAGNWKMNMLIPEAEQLAAGLVGRLQKSPVPEMILAPPFTALSAVRKVLAGTTILIAGQNICSEPKGAFTGEVSAAMLKDAGCRYVILGHSERRHIFGESDSLINAKIQSALANELNIIFCVGETLEQREKDETRQVIEGQVVKGLEGLADSDMDSLVVAYEPVWAIGTGKNATPGQAQEVHGDIRGLIQKLFGKKFSESIRLLYGGSVNPDNCAGLLAQADIDGALVGSASLNADSFYAIINAVN
ncbi:MAG: triose-phosphate isomerase [Nitrospinaceae bacterium]